MAGLTLTVEDIGRVLSGDVPLLEDSNGGCIEVRLKTETNAYEAHNARLEQCIDHLDLILDTFEGDAWTEGELRSLRQELVDA